MAANAARERRDDTGVIEIELRVPDGRFRAIDGALGGPLFRGALIGGFDAAVASFSERVGAKEFLIGKIEPRLRALELRSRGAQLDLVRSWVDLKQQVAFANDAAILEANLRERATHLSAQLDLFDS